MTKEIVAIRVLSKLVSSYPNVKFNIPKKNGVCKERDCWRVMVETNAKSRSDEVSMLAEVETILEESGLNVQFHSGVNV